MGAHSLIIDAPREAPGELRRIRIDTYGGMLFSNLIALFVMLTAAATLHAHGIINIQTSSQAAETLRSLAGRFAIVVFALGIIGTGLPACRSNHKRRKRSTAPSSSRPRSVR